MNNKIFPAPKLMLLVCIWRSTGQSRAPLVCAWAQAETLQMLPNCSEPSSDAKGGLRLCA